MNTKHTQQIRTATAVIAFVAAMGTTAPAFAGHTHDDGEGGAGTTAPPPFAQPLAALGGMTLAEYVNEHHAGNPRTHTVV